MDKDVYSKENNWFRRNELVLLEQARKDREQRIAKRKQEEESRQREELRKAHWLKCPKCGHDMEVINIKGIEIEQCTFCEGVFFDRGELENLLLKDKPVRTSVYRRFFGLE